MKLNLLPISSDKFGYQKEDKCFVTEASDLGGFNFIAPFYDDASDTGFVMVSEWTGESRDFLFNKFKRDDDGDVTSWEFTMLNKDGSESDITATIFND